jgi:hypothetical protein
LILLTIFLDIAITLGDKEGPVEVVQVVKVVFWGQGVLLLELALILEEVEECLVSG